VRHVARAPISSTGPAPSTEPPDVREFLDRFLGQGQGSSRRNTSTSDPIALNSGVLISADGFVMSMGLDAPASAERVNVRTDDGRLLPARYVGGDTSQSLVLFKIDGAPSFPFMPLPPTANEAMPGVGERVVALGRVWFKKQGSVAVTEGLISAVLGEKPWHTKALLTTASIITSMGGGPLFSLSTGQLLGFCGQHFRQSSTGVTVTAAQPLAALLPSVRELQQTGQLQRGWMGIGSNEPNAEELQRMGQTAGGVRLERVEAGGPAERAGMKVGDLLLRLDNLPIEEVEHLYWLTRQRAPGSTVKLDLLRGTERLALSVRLELLKNR
jgi:serine protease Do